ncbi:MAG TPA: FecR domain-containing protein [Spirochaetota bacterium]|nr:FecR domain-containing protein [Spirochaetota bacterium]HPH01349.1 FecR domain-containing protein [Spirochaetota bacterium]
MTRTGICCSLVAILSLASCSTTTQDVAQPQHLVVTSIVGTVKAWKTEDKKKDVRSGFKLEEHWTVQTSGEDALCQMQTPSGSVIKISGNTTLRLSELYKDNKLAVEKTGLELVAGKILVKARTLSGDDSFSVRTKTAVAGVRGTRFIVAYDDEKGTQVAVESGKVAVGQPVAVVLPAGMTNASREIMTALERSTEVVVAPNETIKVTLADNQATQKAVETVVTETLTSGTAVKPEEIRAAVVQIQAKLETAPITRPAKRTLTDADVEIKNDFVAVQALTVTELAPPTGTPATNASGKTDGSTNKPATNATQKAPVVTQQPQIIKRDKEDVNPEERF